MREVKLQFPDNLFQDLKHIAKERKTDFSNVVRYALALFVMSDNVNKDLKGGK